MLITFGILLGTSAYQYFKEAKETLNWIHPYLILMSAIAVEMFHLFCLSVHYLVFSYDGEGLFVLYVFAVISKIIS